MCWLGVREVYYPRTIEGSALFTSATMVKCANPLFLRWVREFHRAKDYRVRGGPPRATGYENAIRGLEAREPMP